MILIIMIAMPTTNAEITIPILKFCFCLILLKIEPPLY